MVRRMRKNTALATDGDGAPATIEEIDALIAAAWDVVTTSREGALEMIERVQAGSTALQYQRGMIQHLLLRARYEGGRDQYIDALVQANEAHRLAQETQEPDLIIRSCRVLGYLYSQLGKYDNALMHLLDAIRRINETGINVMEGIYPIEIYLYNNVAVIYSNVGKTQDALSSFLKAYEMAKELGGSMLSTTLNNVAEMHLILGDSQAALRYNRMALDEVNRLNLGPGDQHQCYNNFGLIYARMGLYTKALENFRQAISIAARSGSKSMQIVSAMDLSRLYLLMDNSAMALEVISTALPLAQEIQANVLLRDIHLLLSDICERTADYKKALEHYKTHMNLSQEVFAKETEQRIGYYEAEFRAQQAIKDAEIYRLINIELRKNSQALEESHRNITAISQIGRELTSTLNIEEILQTLYESVQTLMEANVFGIAFYDEETKVVEYKLMLEEGERIPLSQKKLGDRGTYTERCVFNRVAVVENEVPTDASRLLGAQKERPVRSLIYCPLQFAEKIIGVMTVQSYSPNAYTEQHVNTLMALANYVAIALNNSQKSEALRDAARNLEQLSKLDPLTGLYNRRHIIEKMEEERLRFLRYDTSFSLIILDIDYFKRVNDTYGHDCGDYVLVQVANKMRQLLRQQDCLARWGGEEFLILMPETDADGARALAERLRQSIHDMGLDYNGIYLHVTVTLGICQYVHELSIDEIIMRADRALYRGKKRGRDCVVIYE